jgi:DNA-binding GntR family transcriptional regulator
MMSLTDAEKAYNKIKEKIIRLDMPPGSVITETRLMDDLDLGRTPIREALKRLQSDNLVIFTPRRGMFVADIAITDLMQIYEVRVALEPLCARLAAQRITPEQLEQLQELVREYKRIDPEDRRMLMDLDCRFHRLLSEAANNKFLSNEIDLFHSLSLRIWNLALNYTNPQDIDLDAHVEILGAIEERNFNRAEERMREHIEYFHQTIKHFL